MSSINQKQRFEITENKTIMTEQQEKLGQLIDRLENLSSALNFPLPDKMHVEAFKEALPELVVKLKESFTEITGENPWL